MSEYPKTHRVTTSEEDEFKIWFPTSYNQNFNTKAKESERLHTTAELRIQLAHNWFRAPAGRAVLTTSSGVQSVLAIDFMKKRGLDMPVVAVNIPGREYDMQRDYRELLRKEYDLDLHIFEAQSEADKVAAMDRGLTAIHAGAVLSGIRQSQTLNRAQKSPVEFNPAKGRTEIRPFLEWPDSAVNEYLASLPAKVLHPEYTLGARSIGGVVMKGANTEKTECGLHI